MVDDTTLDAIGVKGEKRKYVKKHGLSSPINCFHGLPWDNEESERVYKICNERNITWEEYYHIKDEESRFY